jgi:hypothetical protein
LGAILDVGEGLERKLIVSAVVLAGEIMFNLPTRLIIPGLMYKDER